MTMATQLANNENLTVTLRDGRKLGYAEYGDPDGEPVIYFHGLMTSRLDGRWFEPEAKKQGIRLIGTDRPGIGLSDLQGGRTIGDWPEQVRQLADQLGLERFAVIGVSAGGPHVSACAAAMPERLTAAGVISGAGPAGVAEAYPQMGWFRRVVGGLWMRVLVWLRFPMAFFFSLLVRGVKSGREAPAWMLRGMPPRDRAIMTNPELRDDFRDGMLESFRQGTGGNVHELSMHTKPWDFRLENIRMPVLLWHGDDDKIVPVSVGRYVAEKIPECGATFFPDEGHLLVMEHTGEILEAIRAAAAERRTEAAVGT
jgi:pimeloyl-ACP methyl ester carboxylesterase